MMEWLREWPCGWSYSCRPALVLTLLMSVRMKRLRFRWSLLGIVVAFVSLEYLSLDERFQTSFYRPLWEDLGLQSSLCYWRAFLKLVGACRFSGVCVVRWGLSMLMNDLMMIWINFLRLGRGDLYIIEKRHWGTTLQRNNSDVFSIKRGIIAFWIVSCSLCSTLIVQFFIWWLLCCVIDILGGKVACSR